MSIYLGYHIVNLFVKNIVERVGDIVSNSATQTLGCSPSLAICSLFAVLLAAMSSSATINVPNNHVSLVLPLVEGASKQFYLQIPLEIINPLCLKPHKYLVYVGWCILGAEGQLAFGHNGNIINHDGELENQGVYYYVVRDQISTFKISFMYNGMLMHSIQQRSHLYR